MYRLLDDVQTEQEKYVEEAHNGEILDQCDHLVAACRPCRDLRRVPCGREIWRRPEGVLEESSTFTSRDRPSAQYCTVIISLSLTPNHQMKWICLDAYDVAQLCDAHTHRICEPVTVRRRARDFPPGVCTSLSY